MLVASDTYDKGVWVRVCTCGTYQHPNGVEYICHDDLVNIVANGRSRLTKFRHFFTGWPVYKYHPDVDGGALDVIGQIIDVNHDDSSLFVIVSLTDSGIEVVNNGLKFLSPVWDCRVVGNAWHPYNLVSVGLTDKPVLTTGEALANSCTDLMDFYLRGDGTGQNVIDDARKKGQSVATAITQLLRR